MPHSDSTLLPALRPVPIEKKLPDIAKAIGDKSELMEAAKLVNKRRDNVLGLLLRALTREEIALMEDRGCRADDWTQVQVAQDFDAFRVRRSHFKGHCILGRFTGDVEVIPGITLPTGIYDCTLINCQVGNDCLLENVRFAANVIVEHQAVLFDVGSITCSGNARFGCGQALKVACEIGGRELPLWAEVTVDEAAVIVRERADAAGQQAVRDAVEKYAKSIASPVTWVRRHAKIRHTERLHDCYVGNSAMIDHALDLSNLAVLSTADEPTSVGGGAAVSDAVLQWGVAVAGNGIVRQSVLLEHSAVDEHATVIQSLIGPNTSITKGEVTASLVGPFVGFHHQSLLIAAYWPEGKGNVAYGAMVGSNHTSRAPDQEIWPGEGTFFGLGCAIRFPTDFSEAPYSVVGMGTSTLPQKMRFPFSLIMVPADPLDESASHVPRAYNELIPAWGLHANAYGLVRTELKFAQRDRAKRHVIDYKVLRPSIMRLVKKAYDRLRAVKKINTVYLEEDIDGIGKNFLRESTRLEAIEFYSRAMKRYALRVLLAEREGNVQIPGSSELAHELADELMSKSDGNERLRLLVEIERANAELVQASKSRDDARGERIIPGYAAAHTPAGQDLVIKSAWERVEKTTNRIRKLGIAI
jgi:hypothetical protein